MIRLNPGKVVEILVPQYRTHYNDRSDSWVEYRNDRSRLLVQARNNVWVYMLYSYVASHRGGLLVISQSNPTKFLIKDYCRDSFDAFLRAAGLRPGLCNNKILLANIDPEAEQLPTFLERIPCPTF